MRARDSAEARLLRNEDAFGTALLILTLDAFGPECLQDPDDPSRGPWHPTTFRTMLADRFAVEPTEANLDKLMAAVMAVTSDEPFKNEDVFVRVANILAGDELDPDTWEKADVLECAWAVTEMLLLHPPDEDDPEPFSPAVRTYIGLAMRDEGFVEAPDVLKIALGGGVAEGIAYGFSDDPEMFEAVYANQREKAAEVEDVLRRLLAELWEQVKGLSLEHGKTDELERQIQRMLKVNAPEEKTGPETVI